MRRFCSLFLGLFAITGTAFAQSPAAAPPAAHETAMVIVDASAAPEEQDALARAAVTQLEEGQFTARIAPPADLLTTGGCHDTLCLRDILPRAHVDFIVHVTLFGSSGHVTSVAVSLIDTGDHGYVTTADITATRDVWVSTRLAVEQVIARRRHGGGTVLRVTGEPAGATLLLDGTEIGSMPWEGVVVPGAHHVAVVTHGERQEQSVDIPEGNVPSVDVHFTGEITADSAPRGFGHYTGPAILGAIGVAGVAIAAAGIAGSHPCDGTDAAGDCIHGGPRPNWTAIGVYGGIGIGAIAGALLWLLLPSHDVAVTSMPETSLGAQIRISL